MPRSRIAAGIYSDYEGRSANSQILVLIRRCIEDFEAEHGSLEK